MIWTLTIALFTQAAMWQEARFTTVGVALAFTAIVSSFALGGIWGLTVVPVSSVAIALYLEVRS